MARPGLTGHRKFRRLSQALGSRIVARGVLELLWEPSYETGDDYVGTADDIEALVGWTGERGVLTRALLEAGAPEGYGFIEPVAPETGSTSPSCYRIHDLWHHAPEYVKKRRERELDRMEKQAPDRNRRRSADSGGHFDRSPDRLPGLDRTLAPAPAPAPAPDVGAEVASDSALSTPGPIFLEFPITGEGGPSWRLREPQVVEWEKRFPNLDVRQASRNALAWLEANPRKRKTRRGMLQFLANWFIGDVDRGRCLKGERPSAPAPKDDQAKKRYGGLKFGQPNGVRS